MRLSLATERGNLKPHGRVSKQISFFTYRPNKMEHMDSPKKDSETLRGTNAVDTDTFASCPPVDPSVYIFSDAIKQAMESFATAHQQSMAHMAEKNAAALRFRFFFSSQYQNQNKYINTYKITHTYIHKLNTYIIIIK